MFIPDDHFVKGNMFSQSGIASKKDLEVEQPPEDSISKVAFSPNSNYLVASSWNNNVCYIFLFKAHRLKEALFWYRLDAMRF